MDVWDPSLPGAGAQRAVLVLQLYMRMGHYSPLSIIVADALSLTFKAGGATLTELSAYLGLTSDRVEIGIEGMPREVYCTSAELGQDDANDEAEGKVNAKRRSRQNGVEESTLRYYINYATLLPFVFAHGSHILLALCQLPVPQQLTKSGMSDKHISLNVSPTLRRVCCKRGLCCVSCRYWMTLKDLQLSITRCPLCQADILAGVLCAIKTRYEEKLSRGQSLLSFGPTHLSTSGSSRSVGTEKGAQEKTVIDDFSDVALARDPFLVQQGLFFQFLYAHAFVCVNDSSFVVDVDEVMTKEEYDYRSKHRATVLDQFRLVHRNIGAIRVKRIDQEKLEAEKCATSLMKLAKRQQLPPWMRPSSLFAEGEEQLSLEANKDGSIAVGVDRKVVRQAKVQSDIVATAKYIAREYFDGDYDEVPLWRSSTDDEKIVFCSSGGGFVPLKPLNVVCEASASSTCISLSDVVNTLAHDDVLLLSILHGVPEEDHDVLAGHLVRILQVASNLSPVEASRLLSVLLLLELKYATQKRNDIHTFMRGNGVVPKVFEGLLAGLSSAEGGLEEELLKSCAVLRDDNHTCFSGSDKCITEKYGMEDTGRCSGNMLPPNVLLEALDYFNGLAEVLSNGCGDVQKEQDVYALAITDMSHRILDVAHISLCQWPWSLRASLRSLLSVVRSISKANTQSVYANRDLVSLSLLEQNVVATIVVLRAVVPALLGTVPRLLGEKDCFDAHYILVQKRCTMLAKLVQKAAHGQLFSGAHETEMAVFNSELPALAQRWVAVFLQLCHETEPPAPQKDTALVRLGEEATLKFCEFLDYQLVHLLHWVMENKPIIEAVFWPRLLRLTRYAERRLGFVGHFALSSLQDEFLRLTTDHDSASSRWMRHMLGFLPHLNNRQQLSDVQTLDNGNVVSSSEKIFEELLLYALSVIVTPEITGLHVSFCGIAGIASDGAVAIFLYWDLLSLYLEKYYAKEELEFPKRCPQFSLYRKSGAIRTGDSFAFLFLLIDIAMSAKGCEGFRVFVVPGNSSKCYKWLRDAFHLLPLKCAAQCVQVVVLNLANENVFHGDLGYSIKITLCRQASDLLAMLEKLRLHISFGCMDYSMILLNERKKRGRSFRKLFPSVSSVLTGEVESGNCTTTCVVPALNASLEIGLWPVTLMRDIFELIHTIICPKGTLSSSPEAAAGVGGNVFEGLMQGIPKNAMCTFRMNAVEFFFNFEGDLLLHLEIEPKWLHEAKLRCHNTLRDDTQLTHHPKGRFRCSWFTASSTRGNEYESYESCLLHVLFLATRRYYAAGSFHTWGGSSVVGLWPSVVLSLRHTTLESLWRLLLYNLWSWFGLAQQMFQNQCPVTCMTRAVRTYLEQTLPQALTADNIHLLVNDEALLNSVAAALATLPVSVRELLQLIIDVCDFIRNIDFEELGSVVSTQRGGDVEMKNDIAVGVLRIVFRKEKPDNTDIIVAHLIATKGKMLLSAPGIL